MTGLEMRYFVLSPRKDSRHGRASRRALEVYAEIIADVNPTLATDLRNWVRDIRRARALVITPAGEELACPDCIQSLGHDGDCA